MAGLLDTDVAALLPLARQGLDWWLGELADLARPLLRDRGGRGLRTVAARRPDGRYALLRDGEPVGLADPAHPRPAAVVLAPELVLVREAAVSGLSRRDALRLLENDIDRLTPFAAAEVYFAVRFPPPAAPGDQLAQVAVTPRARAEAALRAARAGGVRPSALLAETGDGAALDLLPALRPGGASDAVRWSWVAVALLLALNVGAAVWRDVHDTDRLQAEVDRQQPVAARVTALRRQVQAERMRRQALLAERAQAAPLPELALVTRALPDGAWVQHLSSDAGQLRITGYHRPGVDVLAALQGAPGLLAVRNASADLAAVGVNPTLGEPFDVLATLAPAAAKGRR